MNEFVNGSGNALRPRPRWSRTAVACVSVAVLGLFGCSSGNDDRPAESAPSQETVPRVDRSPGGGSVALDDELAIETMLVTSAFIDAVQREALVVALVRGSDGALGADELEAARAVTDEAEQAYVAAIAQLDGSTFPRQLADAVRQADRGLDMHPLARESVDAGRNDPLDSFAMFNNLSRDLLEVQAALPGAVADPDTAAELASVVTLARYKEVLAREAAVGTMVAAQDQYTRWATGDEGQVDGGVACGVAADGGEPTEAPAVDPDCIVYLALEETDMELELLEVLHTSGAPRPEFADILTEMTAGSDYVAWIADIRVAGTDPVRVSDGVEVYNVDVLDAVGGGITVEAWTDAVFELLDALTDGEAAAYALVGS